MYRLCSFAARVRHYVHACAVVFYTAVEHIDAAVVE